MTSTVPEIPAPNPTSAAWSIYIDNQNINLTNLTGGIDEGPLSFLNEDIYQLTTQQAMFGVMVGATGVTLIVMLIFANRKKLRSPLFIINCLNLVVQLIAGILIVAHYAQVSLYGVGQSLLGGVAQYTTTTLNFPDTFASILSLISYALVLASLLLQIYAVFAPQPRTRKIVTLTLMIPAIATWGLNLAWNSLYLEVIWGDIVYILIPNAPPFDQLYNVQEAIQTAIIGITCFILVGKLFFAIRWRRQAGIRKFGVLHVLLIMFGQSLIIPRYSPSRFKLM